MSLQPRDSGHPPISQMDLTHLPFVLKCLFIPTLYYPTLADFHHLDGFFQSFHVLRIPFFRIRGYFQSQEKWLASGVG